MRIVIAIAAALLSTAALAADWQPVPGLPATVFDKGSLERRGSLVTAWVRNTTLGSTEQYTFECTHRRIFPATPVAPDSREEAILTAVCRL